jgi:hypothetical protein
MEVAVESGYITTVYLPVDVGWGIGAHQNPEKGCVDATFDQNFFAA